ncbi:hypothetical protein ACLOJK_028695 [Asimina triloba]
MLAEYVGREGEGRWRTLPERAGLLRCGKSCRLRWMNYLRPSLKRGHIAPDEEDLIIRLHRLLGNRWSLIAGRIPGRTDNEIKNHWNSHLSKRLSSQGIDPRTHKPISPDSNNNSNNNSKSTGSSSTDAIVTFNSAPKPNPNPKYHSPGSQEIKESDESFGDHKDGTTADHDRDHDHVDYYDGGAWILQEAEVDHEGLHNIIGYNYNGRRTDLEYDDDLFSSFLNSLANEDAILQGQQQQQENDISPLSSTLS